MSRSIAQTLNLVRLGRNVSAKSLSQSSRLLTLRNQSNESSSDLGDVDSTASNADPVIRKLEDAIHCIIVRRSEPDWLPFLPGASYWVPPSRSTTDCLVHLLDKFANPIIEEESMSVTAVRGWPSSAYFIQGAAPHPGEAEEISNYDSHSENEEG